jgi:hypothetical protein
VGRGYKHGAHQQQLNASSDPIVSPGRITLACKVKASGLHIPASLLGRSNQRPDPQGAPSTATTTSSSTLGSGSSQNGSRHVGEDVAGTAEEVTGGAGAGATQVAAE